MSQERVSALRALPLVLTLVLAAIGGCASKPAPPESPVLQLEPRSVKTLHFSWTEAAGATGYQLLATPPGGGPEVVAEPPAGETGFDLLAFLPGQPGYRYRLRACNDGGCSESAELTVGAAELTVATGYFKAASVDDSDYFGQAVAVSADGRTLAVGMAGDDSSSRGAGGDPGDNGAEDSGAVYVYARDAAGNWAQTAYLKAANADAYDEFGGALAISGDGSLLVVGARKEASSSTTINAGADDNSASDTGAAYVFTRDAAGNWAQTAYLKAASSTAAFGGAVAVSADGATVAVGAVYDGAGASSGGAVYVFKNDGSGWSQQARLLAGNADHADYLGCALTISADGNTLAVGANHEDSAATGVGGDDTDNTAAESGAVYVFSRDGSGNWAQTAYLKAANTGAGDMFGSALALSADGRLLAVGAVSEDGGSTGINGDAADNSAAGSGAVYIFARPDSGSWSQTSYVKAENTGAGDAFGRSLSLSADGRLLAVGAIGEDGGSTGLNGDAADNSAAGSGAVYIFTSDPDGSWRRQAYLKAPNTYNGASFGEAVALAADGETLAVGAPNEFGGDTGVGGDWSDTSVCCAGAAYVF